MAAVGPYQTALLSILGAETAIALARWGQRTHLFAAAQARARALGRPLVVVGAPGNGGATRIATAYGCGDVCLDLVGCDGCVVEHAVDLTAGPVAAVTADSAVVFVGCVLEYVGDVQAAWRELLRMAGRPENLFVVSVESLSLTAALYPGAAWTVDGTRAGSAVLAATPVTTTRKVVTVGVLAALAVAAWREYRASAH